MKKPLVFLPLVILVAFALISSAQAPAEERPLRESLPHDNFVVREETVPMRDGIKLYTLIMTPKESGGQLPIILRRTPYDATGVLRGHQSFV